MSQIPNGQRQSRIKTSGNGPIPKGTGEEREREKKGEVGVGGGSSQILLCIKPLQTRRAKRKERGGGQEGRKEGREEGG